MKCQHGVPRRVASGHHASRDENAFRWAHAMSQNWVQQQRSAVATNRRHIEQLASCSVAGPAKCDAPVATSVRTRWLSVLKFLGVFLGGGSLGSVAAASLFVLIAYVVWPNDPEHGMLVAPLFGFLAIFCWFAAGVAGLVIVCRTRTIQKRLTNDEQPQGPASPDHAARDG